MWRIFRRYQGAGGYRGFTLVELLVVTSVMSVLIAIILPGFRKAREEARRTVCLAHLKHVGVALFTYANDNRDFGPSVMTPYYRRSPRTLLSGHYGLVNLGLLWPRYAADPVLFRCPSQQKFAYPADLAEMGLDRVAGSYAYAVHVPAEQSPRLTNLRHLAMISDDFTAPPDDDGVGRYAHRNAYNVLYTDGSAAEYSDADESIWKRRIYWDDETDDVTYYSLYDPSGRPITPPSSDGYLDIFLVWHAFCYSTPDPL